MDFLIQVGHRIRDLRLKNKLTQEELALKVGYTSRSSINKIEKGLVDLPQSKIAEIADALGTTPTYLMGWADEVNTAKDQLEGFHLQLFASPEQQLSEGELELVELFRKIPEDQQSLVLSMIRAAVGNK